MPGAIVWARDSAGRTVAAVMSKDDGSYAMVGLTPGSYTLQVQPINSGTTYSLFAAANLSPAWWNASRDFRSLEGVAVQIGKGQTRTRDLTVPDGPPAGEIALVGIGDSWSNLGVQVARGTEEILVGLAGPGVPTTGSPLSVSGEGARKRQRHLLDCIERESARLANRAQILSESLALRIQSGFTQGDCPPTFETGPSNVAAKSAVREPRRVREAQGAVDLFNE